VIPFTETRERLQSSAASLFVKFASDLLKWQDPVFAATDLLRLLAMGTRRIILKHRAPYLTHYRISMQSP
jgi:hypothetical protein